MLSCGLGISSCRVVIVSCGFVILSCGVMILSCCVMNVGCGVVVFGCVVVIGFDEDVCQWFSAAGASGGMAWGGGSVLVDCPGNEFGWWEFVGSLLAIREEPTLGGEALLVMHVCCQVRLSIFRGPGYTIWWRVWERGTGSNWHGLVAWVGRGACAGWANEGSFGTGTQSRCRFQTSGGQVFQLRMGSLLGTWAHSSPLFTFKISPLPECPHPFSPPINLEDPCSGGIKC